MAKVSELKDRARELEQQGELAKAQAIYLHILRHLEGTPALKAELPLYVKVGDLALKQGDARKAVALYERASEHYARAGSAKSIAALAEKIRRADPTQDDAAVTLGRALLAQGHPVAAAEVIRRYVKRVGRDDVEQMLAAASGEPDADAARTRVERGLALLETPPDEPMPRAEVQPPEPEPELEPEPEPEPAEAVSEDVPVEPEPPARASRDEITSSMADTLGVIERASVPAALPEPTASTDLPFLIEHGAADPQAAEPKPREPEPEPEPEPAAERAPEPAPAPAPEPEPEPEPEPAPEPIPPEPEPETAPEPERGPVQPVAERPVEPPAWPEPDREEPAEPTAWPEPEPEPEPVPMVGGTGSEPEFEPSPAPRAAAAAEPRRAAAADAEPRVLVRQPRVRRREPNRAILAAIAAVVVLGGLGAAWAFGWLPFGGGEGPGGGGPSSSAPPVPVTTDTVTAGFAVDSVPLDTTGAADTTAFGRVGFNAVVDSPSVPVAAADTARDTAVRAVPAGRDTVPTPVLPPAGPPPVAAPPVLPTVIVPPGHAIADEIVVIPGLQVLSVAETRAGGAPGYRVIQQAEDGAEIRLVATPGSFGADTVGIGAVQADREGDSVTVGSVRFGRYRVDARAAMPLETLAAYLRQLIRARPVN